MNRRDFVSIAACGSLIAGCASMVTHGVTPVNGAVVLDLATLPELAKDGGSLRIQPAGHPEPIYVLRTDGADGRPHYTALSPICTHRGCTVETQGAVLVCPCHGSAYARSGTVLRGPADRALRSYQVSVRDGGTLEIRL